MNKQLMVTYGLASASIIASGLGGIATFADSTGASDQFDINVPASCTVGGTGTSSHDADISNGTFNSAIGETTIKAFCNDNAGFAIYAIGYTDDEEGKNVLANSALGSVYDIETGTLISGDNSQWAMKLSAITNPAPTYPIIVAGSTADEDKITGDPDYSAFQTVPNSYTKVAYRKASTDIGASAEGSTLKTTYQAYISSTQPAGTYSGQVKYTLIHPNDATAPHKTVYMQDLTSATIAQLLPNINDTATAIDKRDGQEYTIAKLADGKYWMVENLNIAGGTALSSEDTDFDSGYELPTTGGWTVTDGKLVLPNTAVKNDTDDRYTNPSQISSNNYAYVLNSGNKENCGVSGQSALCYSYYSWDAATLGSGRNTSATDIDADYSICPKNWRLPTTRHVDPFDAAVAESSDFYNLATNYGMSTGVWNQSTGSFYTQAGPNTNPNYLISGFIDDINGTNTIFSSNNGSVGYYWSATSTNDSTNALYMYLKSDRINTALSTNRNTGFSVRCLFRD